LKRTIREREAISSEYKGQNGRFQCTANEYLVRERNEGNYRKLNHGWEQEKRTGKRDRCISFLMNLNLGRTELL